MRPARPHALLARPRSIASVSVAAPVLLAAALLGDPFRPARADGPAEVAVKGPIKVPATDADMVLVPEATFTMGTSGGDPAGEPDERPAHLVRVSAFLLDRTEVTTAAYRRCVDAGRCAAPRKPQAAGDLPVTHVSWRDASAHCAFEGKRLPREAEWELAARGEAGRTYPWGNPPPGVDFNPADCARANVGNYRGEGRCPDNPGRPVPPGRFPTGATPDGAHDLAGNVWEWVADAYAPYVSKVTGPAAPSNRSPRVLRGGGCCSTFGLPRSADRIAFPADYSDEDIGFRCARDAR